nr:immunoglobulin heavy chain junction region [Mus musculus]
CARWDYDYDVAYW